MMCRMALHTNASPYREWRKLTVFLEIMQPQMELPVAKENTSINKSRACAILPSSMWAPLLAMLPVTWLTSLPNSLNATMLVMPAQQASRDPAIMTVAVRGSTLCTTSTTALAATWLTLLALLVLLSLLTERSIVAESRLLSLLGMRLFSWLFFRRLSLPEGRSLRTMWPPSGTDAPIDSRVKTLSSPRPAPQPSLELEPGLLGEQ
mmetsp:Transcript_62405/g.140677  ORF Transcript_62405/g.140677 Transcript_62405/m.140677 type:complete len:206 (+) Transcript_62405:877-1494(+)